jgi:diguanylate cyclase (GGDEF)-like protein
MWDFRKPLVALMAPTLLVILSLAVAGGHLPLALTFEQLLPNLPYGLTLLAMALGLWFKRERVVFTALPLGLVNAAMLNLWPQAPGSGPIWDIAYGALCMGLPVYLLSASVFQDRGIFSRSGLVRVLWIFLPVSGALVAVDSAVSVEAQMWMADILHARPFSTDMDFWSHLPQLAILVFGTAMIFLALRFVINPSPMEGAMLGAMSAAWAALHHVGDGAMPSLLLSAALLMLVVVVAQEAYHMAFLDELTGLPGRRALFAEFKRLGRRYSIAMVDVDHFKKFNDTYGHDIGDQVLQMVARNLAQVTGGGRSFRYGGEEFTVVFPGKEIEIVKVHLEALREAIAHSEFALRSEDRPQKAPKDKDRSKPAKKPRTVSVTVSMGVAGPCDDAPDPDTVMKAADKALYKAKEAGRNRVAV